MNNCTCVKDLTRVTARYPGTESGTCLSNHLWHRITHSPKVQGNERHSQTISFFSNTLVPCGCSCSYGWFLPESWQTGYQCHTVADPFIFPERAVREAATICPTSCKLTFDLESGVRVTYDLGYLCANFSLPRPLCSRLRPDVCDRQTSDAHHRLMPPHRGRGHNNVVRHSS